MTGRGAGFSRQQIQREIRAQIKRPRAQRLFKLRAALCILKGIAGFLARVRNGDVCGRRLLTFSDG
ncbi:hypothetical protein AVZ29_19575 [Cronobacter sakazakii]|nr:hypothetical protein AVZ29_19575 [Cronobacter sakazakii]